MKLFNSETSAKARTFRENFLLCSVIQAWYRLISEIEVPVKLIFRLLSIKNRQQSIVFDNKQQHDDDSVYLTIYSYDSFLMRVIEITRTLILLFIMLHQLWTCYSQDTEGCPGSTTIAAIFELLPYYELRLTLKSK